MIKSTTKIIKSLLWSGLGGGIGGVLYFCIYVIYNPVSLTPYFLLFSTISLGFIILVGMIIGLMITCILPLFYKNSVHLVVKIIIGILIATGIALSQQHSENLKLSEILQITCFGLLVGGISGLYAGRSLVPDESGLINPFSGYYTKAIFQGILGGLTGSLLGIILFVWSGYSEGAINIKFIAFLSYFPATVIIGGLIGVMVALATRFTERKFKILENIVAGAALISAIASIFVYLSSYSLRFDPTQKYQTVLHGMTIGIFAALFASYEKRKRIPHE
jgi:hypothetical protein